MNLYEYANNNPLRWVDPLGLDPSWSLPQHLDPGPGGISALSASAMIGVEAQHGLINFPLNILYLLIFLLKLDQRLSRNLPRLTKLFPF